MTSHAGADYDVDDQHWINGHPVPLANPMSPYPRYQHYWKSWDIDALGSVIVELEAEDGTTGVGDVLIIIVILYTVELLFSSCAHLSTSLYIMAKS